MVMKSIICSECLASFVPEDKEQKQKEICNECIENWEEED